MRGTAHASRTCVRCKCSTWPQDSTLWISCYNAFSLKNVFSMPLGQNGMSDDDGAAEDTRFAYFTASVQLRSRTTFSILPTISSARPAHKVCPMSLALPHAPLQRCLSRCQSSGFPFAHHHPTARCQVPPPPTTGITHLWSLSMPSQPLAVTACWLRLRHPAGHCPVSVSILPVRHCPFSHLAVLMLHLLRLSCSLYADDMSAAVLGALRRPTCRYAPFAARLCGAAIIHYPTSSQRAVSPGEPNNLRAPSV